MKRVIVLLALLLLAVGLYAQKLPKFGEVSMDELKMTSYPADSSANAVVLFDKGEVTLTEDLTVILTVHVRIKILNAEGLKWGDRSLRTNRKAETISRLRGATYNLENGAMVTTKMADEGIFKNKYNKYVDQTKFTLPNIKAGSVIEYSYTKRSSASLLPGWVFQYADIPCVVSDYTVNIPDMFTFRKDMRGYLSISGHEKKGMTERFIMQNIPAFRKEPFTACEDDYISSLYFYISELNIPGRPTVYLTKSWDAIVKSYNEADDFGKILDGSNYLKNTVEDLTAGSTDQQKNLAKIYDYVKSHVEWDETTDRIPDRPFKQVLEAQKGSSSEINLMLVCMLRKAGLPANPVFISTRDNGKVREFITQDGQFNDVICRVTVGGKNILLDATDRDLPMGALPERCLNGAGLTITKTGADWIDISSMRSKEVVSADLKLDEQGELTGKITWSRTGIAGSDNRKSYKSEGEEKYVKGVAEGKSWDISKSEFKNMTAPSESANETHELTIHDHVQSAGPVMYINPYVTGRIESNYFKSAERAYPVDFPTPAEDTYFVKLAIPEGYVVDELPKPKAFALPEGAGRFMYSATVNGNVISFTSILTISKTVFLQEEYPVLREFFDQVVAKEAEQIVLKKK